MVEFESALHELKNTEKCYKIVGHLMIASSKDKLSEELESKKEVSELRLKNYLLQEEKLKKMAISIAEQVAQSAEEQPIYNLKSSERRVIHTVLAEHPKVSTVSEGEGPDRHLIVKPKSAES